jgi:hypothetical protein
LGSFTHYDERPQVWSREEQEIVSITWYAAMALENGRLYDAEVLAAAVRTRWLVRSART